MTQFLPPNLLALFAPREPIPFLPPPEKLPHEKKNVHFNYQGVAQFIAGNFEDPGETPPPVKVETKEERLARKKREKEEQVAYKLEQEIALWDPNNPGDGATTDPFKTLFVSRINYYTSESKLRREFEAYGPVKSIHVVTDQKTGKPRGYCFIEYEHERDMHTAYKKADGMKIDGRRVLVDVERARTVKGWLPRRLGGGLGGTRRGGNDVNSRHSGREDGNSRHRSRSRERDRRSRSRSRDRGSRRKRSRSRDRDRDRKRSRRSRSRDRDRRRSRSRDKKRSRRSRSRSRDKESRRRDRDSRRRGDDSKGGFRVKDEPEFGGDGYYDGQDMQIKQEGGQEGNSEDRKPNLMALAQGYEEGGYDDGRY